MRIRLAALDEEGDAVLGVLRAGYAVEARLVGYPELPGLRATVEELRREEVWVAEVDGAVAGVVGLEDGDDGLTIARLVVAPEFARRGLGRALVRHAVALAEDRAVLVGTAAENAPALALYESLGFSRVRQGVVGRGLAYVWLRRPAQA